MEIKIFIEKLKKTPQSIEFQEMMSLIEKYYYFTPTAFQNGNFRNELGQNSGSCKLFAFAKLNELSNEETLACFGKIYFEEVLNNPNGTNHQNIRNFMIFGIEGLHFEQFPLEPKL